MTKREKLLELVNACIDNKVFYKLGSKEQIIPSYVGEFHFNVVNSELDYKFLADYFFYLNLTKIKDEVRKNISEDKIELMSNLKISFEDEPPINFSVKYNIISEKNIRNVEIESNKVESTVITSGFFKRKKIINFLKKVDVKFNHTVYDFTIKVEFNSIVIEITTEEYCSIVKRYEENKIKFLNENDMDKIEERIKKFSK